MLVKQATTRSTAPLKQRQGENQSTSSLPLSLPPLDRSQLVAVVRAATLKLRQQIPHTNGHCISGSALYLADVDVVPLQPSDSVRAKRPKRIRLLETDYHRLASSHRGGYNNRPDHREQYTAVADFASACKLKADIRKLVHTFTAACATRDKS